MSIAWPSEKDAKQLQKDDASERAYLGDSERSSPDLEIGRCDYDDQFEERFSKGTSSIQHFFLFTLKIANITKTN